MLAWRGLRLEADGRRRMAVNVRLAAFDAVAGLPIDHFDGLDSFEDLPSDGRHRPQPLGLVLWPLVLRDRDDDEGEQAEREPQPELAEQQADDRANYQGGKGRELLHRATLGSRPPPCPREIGPVPRDAATRIPGAR